jgi:predicted lipid-binding transport protein (Tim44 family)
MFFDGPGTGFGWVGHMLANIIGGLLSFFALLIVAALIFLVVRFLLVATRAAQLYVDEHSPKAPSAATAPTASAAPAPAAKPATRPRTPKAPPA